VIKFLTAAVLLAVLATGAQAQPLTVDVFNFAGVAGQGPGTDTGTSINFAAPGATLAGSFASSNASFGASFSEFGLSTQFGMDVQGSLSVASTGVYSLTISSDDGSYLYVDGALTVSDGGGHGAFAVTNPAVSLTAGLHPFALQFYQGGGGDELDFAPPAGITFAPGPIVPELSASGVTVPLFFSIGGMLLFEKRRKHLA